MGWTKAQKKEAKALFELAFERESAALVRTVNTHTVETIDDVWALREMLNAKAKEISQKYDYRYSQLIYVFLRLYDDGFLSVEELRRLGDKYEEIDKFFKLRKEHAS